MCAKRLAVPGDVVISRTDITDSDWICGRVDDVITAGKLAYYAEKLIQALGKRFFPFGIP